MLYMKYCLYISGTLCFRNGDDYLKLFYPDSVDNMTRNFWAMTGFTSATCICVIIIFKIRGIPNLSWPSWRQDPLQHYTKKSFSYSGWIQQCNNTVWFKSKCTLLHYFTDTLDNCWLPQVLSVMQPRNLYLIIITIVPCELVLHQGSALSRLSFFSFYITDLKEICKTKRYVDL